MKPPRLDRRITIQKPTTSRGADGSVVKAWVDWAQVYANRKDVPSTRRGEMFASMQVNDSLFTEWIIRYRAGIDGTERILDERGNAANVVGLPSELGRREYLVIIAEQGIVK